MIDIEGMCLSLVLKLAAHGNDVRWYRWAKPGKKIRDGEGMGLKIVDEWEPSMPWAGKDGLIVVTGNFVHLHTLDRYRDLGYKIFGPTVASARLEIERGAGLEAMKSVGIDVPPYQEFTSLEDAQKFARKSDRTFVFKTLGSEDDKANTYVSHDQADMVGWIGRKIARGMTLKGPCLLQEKVEMLAEVGVSGWFGENGFLPDKWNVYFEHKKQYSGEVGQNTGEMGTVLQYCETDKIAAETLVPMEPVLRALGHRGDFAIGAGITKAGKIVPFEWTSRMGYPALFGQMASHRGDPAIWMRALLDGKDALKVSNDVSICVVLVQPPFPAGNGKPQDVEGNPIEGIEEAGSAVYPVAVMKGKGPKMDGGKVVDGPIYQTSGEYVAVCTGLGGTVSRARRSVYAAVDKIHFANMGYRDDIGEKLTPVLPALHKAGFALEMEAE